MAGDSSADAQTEALLVETRRRAGHINRYVDLIPARFYLSSEALQAHKPAGRSSLDPAQYKPTSQLIVDVLSAAAQAEGASAGSSSQAPSKKKKAKKQSSPAAAASDEPASRGDLRKRLEQRIAELKEDRRKKQSAVDRERNAANDKAKGVNNEVKEVKREATPAKRQRTEVSADENDVETGRLSFEPRLGQLPFEAGVNKRGTKVNELRKHLRKEESKMRKLENVQDKDERSALQTQYALDAALRRAKGEKVHDDVSRLRKAQKQLAVTKIKGKEKWDSRVDATHQMAADKQQRRTENLRARRSGKKKGGKGRAGFEGKAGFINSGE